MLVARFIAPVISALLLQVSVAPAQTSSASGQPKKSSSSSASKKKTGTPHNGKSSSSKAKKHAPRKKSTAARTIKLHKSFVASSELRPMARQLIEYRTPAAYTGVEAYADKHAGTEPGALAWFAIGYAHYLDTQFPAAIAALQKAQPYIGELKDYTAYYLGNSYLLNNSPEESLTYLRDFEARFPDSVFSNDATIAYAKALLATKRSAQAVQVLARLEGGGADAQYLLGKAYVQNGQGRSGAEALRRVFYNYPTSQQADWAQLDLNKIPEADMLPPVSYEEREHRAEGLYKARRWDAAIVEYRAMLPGSGGAAVGHQHQAGKLAG